MKAYYFVILTALFIDCGEIARNEQRDPVEQREEDDKLINNYLQNRGFTDIDSTSTGIKFVVVDKGDGEPIQTNDILAINFYAISLEGIVLSTNIQDVIDTAVTVPAVEGEPEVATYSQSGWTFQFIPFVTQLNGDSILEAMGKGLGTMNIGGRLLILLPSQEAFGPQPRGFIPAYSVMIYEIFPVEKL